MSFADMVIIGFGYALVMLVVVVVLAVGYSLYLALKDGRSV